MFDCSNFHLYIYFVKEKSVGLGKRKEGVYLNLTADINKLYAISLKEE